MADPLSISAGVAGLLGLTISITDTCFRYVSSVRGASNAISSFLRAALALKSVLIHFDQLTHDPNSQTNTALFKVAGEVDWEAAENGHDGVIRLLIEKGADVNAKDGFEWTALHRAAIHGHAATTLLLLANGSDINATAPRVDTALHIAVGGGHTEVIALLLEHGIDLKDFDFKQIEYELGIPEASYVKNMNLIIKAKQRQAGALEKSTNNPDHDLDLPIRGVHDKYIMGSKQDEVDE